MQGLGLELTNDNYYGRWSDFQTEAQKRFTLANDGNEIPGILWTSHLTEKGRVARFLDSKKYIVQIWSQGNDTLIKELIENGFRVIFSNHDAMYLDCGFGAFLGEGNNWCSPYKEWQKIYDNSPSQIITELTGTNAKGNPLILGGETPLWAEQVDDTNVDTKVSIYFRFNHYNDAVAGKPCSIK